MNKKGNAIRLTNKTARSLRRQAKSQQQALHAAAVVLSIALCVAAFVLGMQHIIAVPLICLFIIAMDAAIIMIARERFLSLTGQAICTEAAARQLGAQSADAERLENASRELQRIRDDLANRQDSSAPQQDEEDDDDLFPAPGANVHKFPQREEAPVAQPTRPVEPVGQRRRRQARLQVIDNKTRSAN